MIKGTILEKKRISDDIFALKIYAPEIAQHYKPGQFLVVIPDENGERIPLTISDYDQDAGWVQIYFLVVGTSTYKLSQKEKGDVIPHVLGPLGHTDEIKKVGTVLCAGGGVGIATLYPVIKHLKQAGNTVVSVLSARNKERLILVDEIKKYSDAIFITTDDGSAGIKGMVTLGIATVLMNFRVDQVYVVGPVVMMKAVSELTKVRGIKTIASLNPIMVDATGMCGACRVTYGERVVFACVEGPDLDAHKVDFDELIDRLAQYREYEKESFERIKKNGKA